MSERPTRQDRRSQVDWTGQSMTSLCSGALALNLLLVFGLVVLLAINGLSYFWQRPLVQVQLEDGDVLLGEIHQQEPIPPVALEEYAANVPGAPPGGGGTDFDELPTRIQLKVGNRDVTGTDFLWIDEHDIASRSWPDDAIVLERLEYGNFYGFMVELRRAGEVFASGPDRVWEEFQPLHEEKLEQREAIREFEEDRISPLNMRMEALRLEQRALELEDLPPEELERRTAALEADLQEVQARYEELAARLFEMRDRWETGTLVMATAAGQQLEVPVAQVVRAIRANALGTPGKVGLYLSRVWEFVSANPREANTEGGIFPAIFGTVLMVFIMTFAVTPFGVLAALYLREYARQGLLVRTVRIAVNNLAGVPSIVFGVFGLGFFVYLIGGTIDQLFYPEALPTPTYGTGGILWASLTLALLTVPVVIVATEEGLAAVPRIVREGSLALGATKFETTWRVVIPAAAPGILTGMILAMARAAGEVAPLMIVGMVKLAPDLPIDGNFPFLHLERKFMHLGFHIYDVGFQSPNVDATKPLVFATALLLIVVVLVMNLVAIVIRNHLSRRYSSSAF